MNTTPRSEVVAGGEGRKLPSPKRSKRPELPFLLLDHTYKGPVIWQAKDMQDLACKAINFLSGGCELENCSAWKWTRSGWVPVWPWMLQQ